MIKKYSVGTIEKVIKPLKEEIEELKEKVIEAVEMAEDIVKEADEDSIDPSAKIRFTKEQIKKAFDKGFETEPFWIKK